MESLWAEDTFILNKIDELVDFKLDDEFKENLIFLNEVKFKNYEHFSPGLSFFQHLYLWLKDFKPEDRMKALKVLDCVIFFTREEMKILSHQIFREKIRKYLLNKIIEENDEYGSLEYDKAFKYLKDYLNQSLFIALSDGAMIDDFRRFNIEDNDQTISYYKLHTDAQFEIAFKNFEERKKTYRFFFLLEDFVGTGTTFLRDKNNIEFWLSEKNIDTIQNTNEIKINEKLKKPELRGQLIKFISYWNHLLDFNKDYQIIYCPYIITYFSKCRLESMLKYYGNLNYIINYDKIHILPQLVIPNELRVIEECSNSELRNIKREDAKGFKNLCDDYYERIEPTLKPPYKLGDGIKYGFGNRGLSIVRYNNVPNNTVYLIWYPDNWRPLFPRVERHKK
ncbi:MAG: hypothetical protein CEE43_13470 [Promethearchaeota archaeon Loki_b32]|nr:MAG: hypothetical protein CEE43_13470 [Candidatus Lokiarchaeota archaeon Loki_b32]